MSGDSGDKYEQGKRLSVSTRTPFSLGLAQMLLQREKTYATAPQRRGASANA